MVGNFGVLVVYCRLKQRSNKSSDIVIDSRQNQEAFSCVYRRGTRVFVTILQVRGKHLKQNWGTWGRLY